MHKQEKSANNCSNKIETIPTAFPDLCLLRQSNQSETHHVLCLHLPQNHNQSKSSYPAWQNPLKNSLLSASGTEGGCGGHDSFFSLLTDVL